MKILTVNTDRKYNILIENGLLDKAGGHISDVLQCKSLMLVSDTNVYALYGEKVKSQLEAQDYSVYTFIYPAGEESKTPETVLQMVMHMAECGLTREDAVISLGGGVCGDMAGFAAAVYLRGIQYVQIPTTLLSQVDSSVGGKTAVDLPQGKNLCGAFHQPSLVIIDPEVLDTLPGHYFSDGMGEVIKYGCIRSASLFERLENGNAKDFIEEIIYECLDIKRRIVENDETEKGERALLNFGHTCGHAIEKLWDYKTVSHGEAVGMGMVMITRASEYLGITEQGTCQRIALLLEKYGLKTQDTHSADTIVAAMTADKKRTSDGIKLIMLRHIGESFINKVSYEDLPEVFGL
jgi:3-dehydroquinate synthase